MTITSKTIYALAFSAAAALSMTVGSHSAMAADTYAQYDALADRGIITQMPGKTARKIEPRKVNHARYEVMAAKGIYLQPQRDHLSPHQLAARKNHAQYDVLHSDIDG